MFVSLACFITALAVSLPSVHPVVLLPVMGYYLWRASGDIDRALSAVGDDRRAYLDAAVACLVITFTCAVKL